MRPIQPPQIDMSVFQDDKRILIEHEHNNNPDLHIIGKNIPPPSVILNGDTASLGTSTIPAREDHVHGADSAVGFHAYNSSNQTVVTSTLSQQLTYDRLLFCKGMAGYTDSLGAQTIAPATAFIIPSSGFYVVSAGYFLTAELAHFMIQIDTSLIGVALTAYGNYLADRATTSGCKYLVSGTSILVRATNFSGSTATISAYSGDTITPEMPFLSCWKVSGF